jgi:hypothetical protein
MTDSLDACTEEDFGVYGAERQAQFSVTSSQPEELAILIGIR